MQLDVECFRSSALMCFSWSRSVSVTPPAPLPKRAEEAGVLGAVSAH